MRAVDGKQEINLEWPKGTLFVYNYLINLKAVSFQQETFMSSSRTTSEYIHRRIKTSPVAIVSVLRQK